MDETEGVEGRRLARDVMDVHGDVIGEPFEEACVEVGDENALGARAASQRAIVPVPPPTSQHDHSFETPSSPRWRIVAGSWRRARPSTRCFSAAQPWSYM